MIVFNPENKETLSYGESLGPAMEITNKVIAQQYLDDYVKYLEDKLPFPSPDGKSALEVAKNNIGYYSGYYSRKVRKRVCEIFETEHPFA